MAEKIVSVERVGTVDKGASAVEVFPFDAFEFNPLLAILTLKTPWILGGLGTSLKTAKVDTAANLASTNPVLLAGQIGYESDTKYFKIGDGATAYTSLMYQMQRTLEALYTPTCQGLGTLAASNVSWTRDGNRLKVMGRITAGTVAHSEFRIGFPGSIVADPAIIGGLTLVGSIVRPAAISAFIGLTAEASAGYVTMVSSAGGGLTKQFADNIFGTGDTVTFFFEVPISGWNT